MLPRIAASALILFTALAHAQTNTFELRAGGAKIGQASYTLAKTKSGYRLSVRSDAQIGGHPSEVSEDFKYDENYAFQEGDIDNRDMHVHNGYVPSKDRTEVVATVAHNGVQVSKSLVCKPAVALLPGFDPGAAQVMLLLATTHPTPTSSYSIIVPGGGEGGGGGDDGASGGGRGGRGHQSAAAAPAPGAAAPQSQGPEPGGDAADGLWKKAQDLTGNLDGKSIPIHAYLLASGSFRWIFFADDANTLMQVTLPTLHATYVRQNFHLDLPPTPPPAAPKP
jgi:hypothetical protein